MRASLELDGTWELAGFPEGQGDWSWPDDGYPIAACVPGEVHPALQEAGRIPDPFYGTNTDRVQWIEEKEWWYRRRFRVPKGFGRSRTFLEFDGLDTLATVLLNGEVVGEGANMFTPYRFEVTGKLREGAENTVEVRFKPAARAASRRDLDRLRARYERDRLAIRKMQAQFGWDWMPRLVGAGIWRGVRLVSYDRLSVEDVHVQSEVRDEHAQVRVEVAVWSHEPWAVDGTVAISVGRGEEFRCVEIAETVSAGGSVLTASFRIDEPERWWPNGMGEQPLYEAHVALYAEGEEVDSRSVRFGLRTVELHERNEEGEPAFFFSINGVPFFAKGADWIPPDAFPSRVTPERYRDLLALARDAGLNMIRVWGGGIYEKPEFYDLCNRLGILIWQDFMFSLAEYPQDPGFRAEVAREAHAVVRGLRNHPCIALWCGNNECELDIQPGMVWSGRDLFHEVIPRTVRELDLERPYWPSSPYGGRLAHCGDHGDYHGEPWFHTAHCGAHVWRECIRNDRGLFMSEFPLQGSPEAESLRRFLPARDLFPPKGKVWAEHAGNNKHREGKIGLTSLEALRRNIRDMIGEPRDIEEFARMSGVLHGEFLRAQVEHYRIRRLDVGGALLWMFADAWPAVGFSIVDYYGRPKAAYYYAKRAFAPLLLAFEEREGEVDAWVVNDRLEPLEGLVSVGWVERGRLAGAMERIPVSIPANTARRVWTAASPAETSSEWLVGMVDALGACARGSYFFALPREMEFPGARVRVQRENVGDTLVLALESEAYARTVSLDGLPDGARPDDNYFDLFPGEVRRIGVRGLTRDEAERVRVRVGPGAGVPVEPARVPPPNGRRRRQVAVAGTTAAQSGAGRL